MGCSAHKCGQTSLSWLHQRIAGAIFFEMAPTSAQIIENARSTHALFKVVVEKNKQCFKDAYISEVSKVEDVLKRKCGSDPFRIQVWENPIQRVASRLELL